MTSATDITTTATPIRAATLPPSSDSRRGARVKATLSVPRVNSLAVLLMNAASTSTLLKIIDDTTAAVAPPAPRMRLERDPVVALQRRRLGGLEQQPGGEHRERRRDDAEHDPQPAPVEQHPFGTNRVDHRCPPTPTRLRKRASRSARTWCSSLTTTPDAWAARLIAAASAYGVLAGLEHDPQRAGTLVVHDAVAAEPSDDLRRAVAAVAPGADDQHVVGPGAQLGDRPAVHEPALVDDDQPVADRLQLGEQVRRDDHGLALVADVADEPPHVLHPDRVEPVRRLVEDDQLGIADQRGGDAEPLLHAERVAAVAVVAAAAESDELDQVVDAVDRDARRGSPAPAGCRPPDTAGWKAGDSISEPTRGRYAARSDTGAPSTQASPDVGRTSPSSMPMIVVLPAPFGPTRPVTDPAGTENETASTTVRDPNRLVRRSATTACVADPPWRCTNSCFDDAGPSVARRRPGVEIRSAPSTSDVETAVDSAHRLVSGTPSRQLWTRGRTACLTPGGAPKPGARHPVLRRAP